MPGTFPSQAQFNTLIVASGAPASYTGNNGDAYIDSAANMFYGPKANGAWPTGVSMIGPTGSTGSTGATGSQGAAGTNGTNGTNGNTIISGTTSPPPSGTGNAGDYYYNTSTYVLWGPKTNATTWPSSGTSLVGPQGTQGAAGTNGTNGNTVLNGSGAPASGTGNNGDFYIDTGAYKIYGPKVSGAWPGTGTSLVGPQGATGASGTGGGSLAPVVLSSTAPTLASTNSGTTYMLTGASQLSISLPASDANIYTYTFCHVAGAGGVKIVPGDSGGSIVTPGGASAGSATGYVSEASIGTWFTLVRAASTSTWYMGPYSTPTNNAFTVGS